MVLKAYFLLRNFAILIVLFLDFLLYAFVCLDFQGVIELLDFCLFCRFGA